MRNLFLLLLLSNICLGLWVYTQEKAAAEAALPRQPSAAAKPLVLLSELSASEIQEAKIVPLAPPEKMRKAAVPSVVEVVDENPGAAEQIELVVEEALLATPEPVVLPEQECFTLGPFADAAKSKRALGLLTTAGAKASQRENQEQVPYGYRVFIPPLSSRERAYELADKLRGAGIKDYFVITNPNDKLNGISLGLFKQRTGAIKRVAQLRNMEYRASIEVRYKDKAIYWVDYAADIGSVGAQVLLEAGEGVTGMQHLVRACAEAE